MINHSSVGLCGALLSQKALGILLGPLLSFLGLRFDHKTAILGLKFDHKTAILGLKFDQL